jgi:hypothetical protein
VTAPLLDRGLDLSRPDEMTPAEYEAFKADYRAKKGHALPAFDFWVEHRPDVLKRYRLQGRRTPQEEALGIGLAGTLSYLHYYGIVGYRDGILYEIRNAQSRGATRAQLLATLDVAFLHAAEPGMAAVAAAAAGHLRDALDPERPGTFPAGWAVDPAALRSGMDFSSPEATPKDVQALETWYLRVCGEVPRHVRLLGEHRPALLKASRNRFEHALGEALPKQALPYLLLHWNTIRGSAPGIREAALLARGFGMKRAEAFDAISRALLYGGMAAAAVAHRAAGDVLAEWPA